MMKKIQLALFAIAVFAMAPLTISGGARAMPNNAHGKGPQSLGNQTAQSAASNVATNSGNLGLGNEAPIADAGADLTVTPGDLVKLDGSRSLDPKEKLLVYAWRFVSRPAGSRAALDDDRALRPVFTVDAPGDYVLELIVAAGNRVSAPDQVMLSTANTAPRAEAGPARPAALGAALELDGSGSSDAEGDRWSHAWTLAETPPGSAAVLSGADGVHPLLIPDLAGDYRVELAVSDGNAVSAPDSVTITSGNAAPRANAGEDQTVSVGTVIHLNAALSSDPDGDPLAYSWAMIGAPPLTARQQHAQNGLRPNPHTSKPGRYRLGATIGGGAWSHDQADLRASFIPEAAGDYVFQLTVIDSAGRRSRDTVVISTGNSAPVAQAGRDVTAGAGAILQLDGSGSSDADGDRLTYHWALTAAPANSLATLSDPDAVRPELNLDLDGTYVAQLMVFDGTLFSAADTVVIRSDDSAPRAEAGREIFARVGDIVSLDAGGSSDPDGTALSYRWSVLEQHLSSAAQPGSPAAGSTNYLVDREGFHVLQLEVDDGLHAPTFDSLVITTVDSRPIAVINPGLEVFRQDLVQLHGSASFDPDGTDITYFWAILAAPDGSAVALDDPTAVSPSFTPDLLGSYVAQLIVSDGESFSAPVTTLIETVNQIPVADAGPDQQVFIDELVTLDGSASRDLDGDPITYLWQIVTAPAGSIATLSDPTAVNPSFTPDIRGPFVVRLVVNDGIDASAPDSMTVDIFNRAPTAVAGDDQTVTEGDNVALDGGDSSDPDRDPLTYSWSFISLPPGSGASFDDPNAVTPSFLADAVGDYQVQLVVNDGDLDSPASLLTVTAESLAVANVAPELDPVGNQTVPLGMTLRLPLTARDLNNDPLSFIATPLPLPEGAFLDGTSGEFIYTPIPDQVGSLVVTFIVSDGLLSDSESITVTVPPPDSNGITTLVSRVLDANDLAQGIETPIEGATVSFVGQNLLATTGADGSFELMSADAGTQQLDIDPDTISSTPGDPRFAAAVLPAVLIAQVANEPADPFVLARIDAASCSPVVAGVATTASDAASGVSLMVDAGGATQGGAVANEICLAEVPPSLVQNLLPPSILPCQLISIQAFDLDFAPSGTITFPNLDNLAPGSEVDIWFMPRGMNSWSIVGAGVVSGDALTVASDTPNITGGGYVFAVPPAPMAVLTEDYNARNVTPTALRDGNFSTSYRLPTYQSLGVDRGPTFVYNSTGADPRPVVAADTTVFARAALPPTLTGALSVGGVAVAGPVFTSTALPAPGLDENSDQTLRQALQFDAGDLPSGVYPYSFTATSHYDCSKVSAESRGDVLVNNQVQSDFGSGWTLAGLDRLTVQDDGRVVLTEGDGTQLVFRPFGGVVESGDIRELRDPPADITPGALESDTELVIFNEAFNLSLPGAMVLDSVRPVRHRFASELVGDTLAAGTVINSHLIHLDPLGSAGGASRTATITFPTDILGIIAFNAGLHASDPLVGADGTLYPTGIDRQVEFGGVDAVFVSNDKRTVTVTLVEGAGVDQLRVITAGEDEVVAAERFDSNNGGWRVVGDPATPSYRTSGGNPGGYVFSIDRTNGVSWFWRAPLSFLGDRSEVYNGRLSFDLRQNRSGRQFNVSDDVYLVGAGLTIRHALVYNPETTWTHFSVPLSETANWILHGTSRAPTRSEFDAILADLTDLRIRGEYRSGPDTGSLDNPIFSRNPTGALLLTEYANPAGDFSTLDRYPDGSFSRTLRDGTVYAFDAAGFMTSVADRNGNTTSYAYDAGGQLIAVTDPVGLATGYSYGPDGKLQAVTDPAGRITSYIYDADGKMITAIDPMAAERRFAYSQDRGLTAVTNERGFATINDYGFAGQFLGSDRPDGSSVANGVLRDLGLADLPAGFGTQSNPAPFALPAGLVASSSDGNGNRVTLKLDPFGAPTETTGASGRTTLYERNADGLATRIARESGGELPDGTVPGFVVTEFDYDNRGNVTARRDAVGTALERQTAFDYEPAFSRVTRITDPAGNGTQFLYDANGNRLQTIDPLNGAGTPSQVSTYDANGLELTRADANGNVTQFAHDPATGNLILETDAALNEKRFIRDSAGRVINQTDGLGTVEARSVAAAYDDMNRVTSIVDGTAVLAELDYDPAGNRTGLTVDGNLVQSRGYDALDRVVTLDNRATGLTAQSYDAAGNVKTRTNALGGVTNYNYDAANREIEWLDPFLNQRTFAYDASDNQVSATDGRGKTTTFRHDLLNRQIGRSNALGQSWAFAHDSRDNLETVTDPKLQVVSHAFDALSRLTGIVTPDNSLTFGYDAQGNRITATDGDSDLAFTYDALNRLRTADTLAGGVQPLVSLTSLYDAVGNRRELSESSGADTLYDYDGRGVMTRLTTADSQSVDLVFRGDGALEQILYPNGVVSGLTYDPFDQRVDSLTHSMAGASLLDLDFGYDAGGNVISILEDGQSRNFTYDLLQQIESGGFATAPEFYDYDEEGNRTASHRSALHDIDDANRLMEDDAYLYSYDANGNLAGKTDKATLAATLYGWNAQDQLIRIDFADGSFAAYRYDALGRRTEKDLDGAITRYVYDGSNIVQEYDGSGTIQARYSHGDQVDQPLAMTRNGQAYYFQADHLGSIRRVTDATGAVVNAYDYDSFGNFEVRTEFVANPYTYAAKEFDVESGLICYPTRYYDANSGRFISETPSETAPGGRS